jgi:hypothetical protein
MDPLLAAYRNLFAFTALIALIFGLLRMDGGAIAFGVIAGACVIAQVMVLRSRL